jgi:hypothetical protein
LGQAWDKLGQGQENSDQTDSDFIARRRKL